MIDRCLVWAKREDEKKSTKRKVRGVAYSKVTEEITRKVFRRFVKPHGLQLKPVNMFNYDLRLFDELKKVYANNFVDGGMVI